MNREEFINKSNNIHNNKYDYSKVIYKNSKTKIIIICLKHGEFLQKPSHHLSGHGCMICGGKNKKSLETFIKEANLTHNDKYDYSKSIYKNNKTKIIIICPTHGEFKQSIKSHLNGNGCSKCSNRYRLSEKEFISKANDVHNNRYDYSNINYKNSKIKIDIICNIHGMFSQIPYCHINGSGCPICYGKKTTKEFVECANKIHNKYDYSKVDYKNTDSKVIIICLIHGEFLQSPYYHLRGNGCPKCFGKNKTTEDFIKQAKLIHDDKYNYSKVIYQNTSKKICIICYKHGEFQQMPGSHLHGAGCPTCFGNKKINKDEFIKRACLIHDNMYDYSKVTIKNTNSKVIIICLKHGEFSQRASNHLLGHGCAKCVNNISKSSQDWIDSFNNNKILRERSIIINGKRFIPDGIDFETNTIYEFNGDFWHGNIKIFNPDDIHPRIGITFGKLYQKTIEKEKYYKVNGFNVISIWESEWKNKFTDVV